MTSSLQNKPTTAYPWYNGHSTNISACGVWKVRAGVQVSNIVFGSVDFRGDGKYRKENLSFPLFGNEGKMGGVEN